MHGVELIHTQVRQVLSEHAQSLITARAPNAKRVSVTMLGKIFSEHAQSLIIETVPLFEL